MRREGAPADAGRGSGDRADAGIERLGQGGRRRRCGEARTINPFYIVAVIDRLPALADHDFAISRTGANVIQVLRNNIWLPVGAPIIRMLPITPNIEVSPIAIVRAGRRVIPFDFDQIPGDVGDADVGDGARRRAGVLRPRPRASTQGYYDDERYKEELAGIEKSRRKLKHDHLQEKNLAHVHADILTQYRQDTTHPALAEPAWRGRARYPILN